MKSGIKVIRRSELVFIGKQILVATRVSGFERRWQVEIDERHPLLQPSNVSSFDFAKTHAVVTVEDNHCGVQVVFDVLKELSDSVVHYRWHI